MEVNALVKEGAQIQNTRYFVKGSKAGVYLFVDTKGFITMILRETLNYRPVNKPDIHSYKFLSRTYSGFPKIKAVATQGIMMYFATDDKISFFKVTDNSVAPSYCSVSGTTITSLDYDRHKRGSLYVGTESGAIYAFLAISKNKTDIECKSVGKIQETDVEHNNIRILDKTLISYDNSGVFQVYDLKAVKSLPEEDSLDYSEVTPVSFKPNYPTGNGTDNVTLDICVSDTQFGKSLLYRVPGEKGKLIMLDVINKGIYTPPWYLPYVTNKGLLLAIGVGAIIMIQVYRSDLRNSSQSSNSIKGLKNSVEHAQNQQRRKLDEIQKKLQNVEGATKSMSDFTGNIKGVLNKEGTPRGGNRKNVRFADD